MFAVLYESLASLETFVTVIASFLLINSTIAISIFLLFIFSTFFLAFLPASCLLDSPSFEGSDFLNLSLINYTSSCSSCNTSFATKLSYSSIDKPKLCNRKPKDNKILRNSLIQMISF